jgi:hypothetical protein
MRKDGVKHADEKIACLTPSFLVMQKIIPKKFIIYQLLVHASY